MSPLPPARGSGPPGSTVSSPAAPEKVGFEVFQGIRNHQFLLTTYYSPVIVSLSLGMTVFLQPGLKSQHGRSEKG